MRLDWKIKGDNLIIQLVSDDEQGEIIESEISIPRSTLISRTSKKTIDENNR